MFYFKKGHVVCVFGNMREKMMSSKYLEDWILKKYSNNGSWAPYSVFQIQLTTKHLSTRFPSDFFIC